MASNMTLTLTPPQGSTVARLLGSDGIFYPVVNGTITIPYLAIEKGIQNLLAAGWTSTQAS
jgi:hypothetical protein